VFGIPGAGPGGGREWVTLAVLAATLLALLAFRGLIRAGRTIDRSTHAVPDAAEISPRPDPTDPIRREVLARKQAEAVQPAPDSRERPPTSPKETPAESGPAAAEGPRGPGGPARVVAAEAPEPRGWGGERSPAEIPVLDSKWLHDTERAEEAERAAFLPMLEKFTPLEPEPILAWRQRIAERVESGAALVLPSPGGDRRVVGASPEGLELESPGGPRQNLAWGELSVAELYSLAKAAAEVRAGEEKALDVLFLAQLAELAGRASEAADLRAKAVALDSSLAEAAAQPARVALDLRVLDQFSWAWDDLQTPEPANSLADDAPSILHVYRYMRTVGMEKLRASSNRNPKYGELLNRPAENRGKAITLIARFVKRFKSMRFTKHKEHLEAGIQDLDFCFIVDTHVRGIYLVSAPQDLRGFTDSDIVLVTGVYIRRWPYMRHGEWRWVPYLAALSVEKYELPPIKGLRFAVTLLVIGAVGLFAVLFVFARRDARGGSELRERLSRLRGGREHIRRKVAEAVSKGAPPPQEKG